MTILKVMTEEPVPPRSLHPDIARDLETICLKCLQKDAARRYASAEMLAHDLRRFLTDRPILARPTRMPERGVRWCRRNPILASMAAMVVGLLFVIAVGSTYSALRLRRELWKSYAAEAKAHIRSNRPGRRAAALDALSGAIRIHGTPELRDDAISAMTLIDVRPITTWQIGQPKGTIAYFDSLLERYACGDLAGDILIRRTSDNHEIKRLAGTGATAWVIQFSADGRYLCARMHPPGRDDMGRFRIWDTSSGRIVLERPARGIGLGCELSSGPNNHCAAFLEADSSSIVHYNLLTGATIKTLGESARPMTLAFSPDGQRLAVSNLNPSVVQIYDMSEGKVILTLKHPEGSVLRGMAWRPDGKLLAVACSTYHIYVWDTVSGALCSALRGHRSEPTTVTFNPRGNLIASTGWDGSVRIWSPTIENQLCHFPGDASPVQFSPDGSRLASNLGNGLLRLWDVADGRECRSLGESHTVGKGPRTLDIDSHSRLVASVCGDGVRLWDLERDCDLAVVWPEESSSVVFNTDGTSLFTHSKSGVRRWPIKYGPTAASGAQDLVIGPPERLYAPADGPTATQNWSGQMAVSRGGSTLAVVDQSRNRVLAFQAGQAEPRVLLDNRTELDGVSISPDGAWVAVSTWHGSGTTLLDTRTGRIAQLTERDAETAFSPDGETFVAGTEDRYQCWDVEPWLAGARTPWKTRFIVPRSQGGIRGMLAFSPDGRILAAVDTVGEIHLLEVNSGRLYAVLPLNVPQPINAMRFSPDGAKLIIACVNHVIWVWDLARVSRQLTALGMDSCVPDARSLSQTDSFLPLSVEVRRSSSGP